MTIGIEYLGVSLRITTVVVPVAVYFLILGLLNTRRHPQLLSGRLDFCLLLAAMGPLALLPVLGLFGTSVLSMAAAVAALVAAAFILSPSRGQWVIYNLSAQEGARLVRQALQRMGLETQGSGTEFRIVGCEGTIRLSAFPVLRNVTVRLEGADGQFQQRFADALAEILARDRSEQNPAAVALLLVAMARLVAPLALMARHAPEIVRLLTDLLP
ncbi:MAG TPA: hypothetical protein DCX07_16450 [Phycisphaerales bacterium]|nr:hypothetical protein [Phycisphaerales bacterium]